MLRYIVTVSLWCFVLKTGVNAFLCNSKQIQNGKVITSSTMNCDDKKLGDYVDKCMVQVNTTGTNIMVAGFCLPTSVQTFCGTTMKMGASNLKYCCCDTEKCNDDAFIKNCQGGGGTPTTAPSGFQCYMGDAKNKGKTDCSLDTANSKKCGVVVKDGQIYSTCVPKANAPQCGSTVNGTKTCCCDTALCNDAKFVKQCQQTPASTSAPTAPTAAQTVPTAGPSGFQCYNGDTKNQIKTDCSLDKSNSKKCGIVITNGQIYSTCVPKANAPQCGSTVNGTKSCCCDTALCNDAKFVKQCQQPPGSSSVMVSVGSAVIFMSSLLSLLTVTQ